MLSTRPTSILNREVGLRILVVIVCYLHLESFQINFI